MTTIIEQMAKAIGSADLSKPGWNEQAARAALAVLAESDLPDAAIVAGGKAADDATEHDAPKFLEIVFKATVRAIIEEQRS